MILKMCTVTKVAQAFELVFMNEYTKYLLTSFPGVEYELQDKNL